MKIITFNRMRLSLRVLISGLAIMGGASSRSFAVDSGPMFSSISGNIGIGTLAPTSKLHVMGVGQFGIYDANQNTIGGLLMASGTGSGGSRQYWIGASLNPTTHNNNNFQITDYLAGTYNTPLLTIYGGHMGAQTGFVGIGTTAPQSKLHVHGVGAFGIFNANVNNRGGLLLASGTGVGGARQYWIGASAGPNAHNNNNFQISDFDGATNTPLITIYGAHNGAAGGHVGIGTDQPMTRLSIMSGNPIGVGLEDNYTTGISFGRVRTNHGKYVLINSDDNIFRIAFAPLVGSTHDEYTSRLVINHLGDVGIGTGLPVGYKLNVNGPLFINSDQTTKISNLSWNNPSDIRLKDVQGNFEYGLDKLMQLQPVRYRFKANNPYKASPNEEHIGFVAQDVQKVIPEAVAMGSDGYLRLTADSIHWTMLNSIKELKLQNDEMKAKSLKYEKMSVENERLKSEVDQLKLRLDALEKKASRKEEAR